MMASSGTLISQHGTALTSKGLKARARLLACGRSVLEERGYYDATVAEIADSAEMALGNFYRYFPNKEALFMALLDDVVAELYESAVGVWREDDPLESLRETSIRYLHTYYSNRALIGALLQMAGAVPECAALWWELRTRTFKRMEAYVRPAVPSGVDAGLVASALGSMVEQFAFHWFVEADRSGKKVPKVARAAETVAFIWYEAIYGRREPT